MMTLNTLLQALAKLIAPRKTVSFPLNHADPIALLHKLDGLNY